MRTLRFVAPSVVAACAAALAVGIGLGWQDDAYAIAVATGFGAIAIAPAALAASLALRGIARAWRPRELVARLTDADGRAPRLAAWATVAWLGVAWLAWTGFQATWMLANWTSFKTLPVALGMPLFEVGAALLAIVLSRPAALLLAALYRRLCTTPRRIAIGAALATAGAATGGVLYMRHRLGGLDPALLLGPALAGAALAIVHAADRATRPRPRARRLATAVAALATAATIAAIAVAVRAPGTAPALVVATWGEHRTAGFAISHLYDLEAIRAHVPLADLAPAPRPGPHRDIVLVTVDALRADHTPAAAPRSGAPPRAEMPALGGLADRGFAFEWAFSTANTAPRALPAALIGVAANRIRDPRDPRHVVLAERFAGAGYDTAGFFDEPPPSVPLRGLAHVERAPGSTPLAVAQHAHRYLTARDAPSAKPLFLWVRFSGPRDWQSATANELHTDDERRAAYDRTLAAVDAGIAELLAAFAERGSDPARAPIFVIAGECGEGLGDHGQLSHGADLYDAATRVPLVVSGPSIVHGRALEAVSLVDLVPSLLDLAGFVPPRGPDIDGASFADVATGRRASLPDGGIAFVELPKDAANPVPVTAVIKGAYKLIAFTNGNELYNIHADPDEKFNLMTQLPKRIVELRGHLEARDQRAHTQPFTLR